MSADFWAGYLSGAVGIIMGSPLDIIKVRLQADRGVATPGPATYARQFETTGALVKGSAAPILGYGALNAVLFVTYNRTEAFLGGAFGGNHTLWSIWLAGAAGGLATWVVSSPTELVKCRVQMACPPMSSALVARNIWRAEGLRGLYFGGGVTALRDSIGYGFYFWSYELSTRFMAERTATSPLALQGSINVFLSGGLAGLVTWASIYPLDVLKTRVQTQPFAQLLETSPLLPADGAGRQQRYRRFGAVQAAKQAYGEGGISVFFRGLVVCSIRAFLVNAIQWAVYEWVMNALDSGRIKRQSDLGVK